MKARHEPSRRALLQPRSSSVFLAIGDAFAQDGGDRSQWKRQPRIRDQEEPLSLLTIALLDDSLFEGAFCFLLFFQVIL